MNIEVERLGTTNITGTVIVIITTMIDIDTDYETDNQEETNFLLAPGEKSFTTIVSVR